MGKRITQEELIRKHIIKKGSITSWEAIQRYGVTRISAVIYLLREEGMKIKTEYIVKKNRYGYLVKFGKYSLEK
jgi:hypothetical protein